MPNSSTHKKRQLVIFIALFAVLAFLGLAWYRGQHKNKINQQAIAAEKRLPATSISTTSLPTEGAENAPNEIVAIEDLKCFGCRIYNLGVYRQIKKELIDTGRVKYKVLLLSFLPGSLPAGNAAYCLRQKGPAAFFDFLRYVYENQPPESLNWATPARLTQYASNSVPGFDSEKFMQCVSTGAYTKQLNDNLKQAATLLNNQIQTPTLFVNGHRVQRISMENIRSFLK